MQISTISVYLTAFLLILVTSLLLLKYYWLPKIIQSQIENHPLDKEPKLEFCSLKSISDLGFDIDLIGFIPHSKLPADFIWITAKIPIIRVYDAALGNLLVDVHLSDEVIASGKSNVNIKQSLHFDLCDNVDALKRMTTMLLIGSESEIDRTSLRVEFNLSINIMNWIVIENLPCKKTINLGELKELKKQTAAAMESSSQIKSKGMADLLPIASITPLPVTPRLQSIIGGMKIEFVKPPNLVFSLGTVCFDAILNGSRVAHCILEGLQFSETCNTVEITLKVKPSIISNRPISGLASTARGLIRGAVVGTLNGLLYGEWGSGATIIGIGNLSIQHKHGKSVKWLQDILDVITLEYDFNVLKETAQVRNDLVSGLHRVVIDVIQYAKSQSSCAVM